MQILVFDIFGKLIVLVVDDTHFIVLYKIMEIMMAERPMYKRMPKLLNTIASAFYLYASIEKFISLQLC